MFLCNVENEQVKVYNYTEIEEVINEIKEQIEWTYKLVYVDKKAHREYYLNIPTSFDIETSSWYELEYNEKLKQDLTKYNEELAKNIKKDTIQYTTDEHALFTKRLNIISNTIKHYLKKDLTKQVKDKIHKLQEERRVLREIVEKFEPRGCMYCWQMAIGKNGGTVVFGRTWQEWIQFMADLKNAFNLDEEHFICCYIHNAQFEFQWIKGFFTWADIFTDNRTLYYAKTAGLYVSDEDSPTGVAVDEFKGFVFKDSLVLSGVKEEKLNKVMLKYGDRCRKLAGALNYDLIRHSETELTEQEIAYCINDVRTLNWYIQDRQEQEGTDGKICNIKLTKTQYIRDYIRNCLFYSDPSIKNKKDSKYIKHHELMQNLKIDLKTFRQLECAFQGGLTRASHYNAGKVLTDIDSYDITSSYPTVIVCEKFPMTTFERVDKVEDMKYYLSKPEKYACLFDIHLTNLRVKEIYDKDENLVEDYDFEHILSFAKGHEYADKYGRQYEPQGVELDNGRIIECKSYYCSMNEIDFINISSFYEFDYELFNFSECRKQYLPKGLVEGVLKLFKDKCLYKKYDKTGKPEEVLYKIAKEYLNSVYGCMVSSPLKPSYSMDDNLRFNIIELDDDEVSAKLEEYLDRQSTFLAYAWGVWITSYARTNLLKAIKFNKFNHCYCDTDSEKSIKSEELKDFYDNYNKEIDNKMNKAFEYHGLPKDSHKIEYEDKNGNKKTTCLGYYMYEGQYKRFATCGAKRYIVEKDGEIEITVAGLSKKCVEYLIDTYKDELFEKFAEGDIYVPREFTNKLTVTYLDFSTKGKVTDYKGNTIKYYEITSVQFDKVAFDLSLTEEYSEYIGVAFNGGEIIEVEAL